MIFYFLFFICQQARVHQYQAQISKLQLENESMRGQLRGLEAACAGEVHAALVARLATLETEHAALARDADAQRRQYERCLDDVANQVVRALLSQKVHCYALVTTSSTCLSSLLISPFNSHLFYSFFVAMKYSRHSIFMSNYLMICDIEVNYVAFKIYSYF